MADHGPPSLLTSRKKVEISGNGGCGNLSLLHRFRCVFCHFLFTSVTIYCLFPEYIYVIICIRGGPGCAKFRSYYDLVVFSYYWWVRFQWKKGYFQWKKGVKESPKWEKRRKIGRKWGKEAGADSDFQWKKGYFQWKKWFI